MKNDKQWYKVADKNIIRIGEVKTVYAGHETVCLTRTDKGYGAICNSCPHQGGPLGEGFIDDRGWVICPWHGYEYDPIDGTVPGGYDDIAQPFEVEEREDGIYVAIIDKKHKETISDQIVKTMLEWGVDTVFGMVGHSNLGMADAFYKVEQKGRLKYIGVRHEGAAAFAASGYAKLTGKPAVCFAIAGPGATNLLTGLWDAKVDRVPILAFTGQIATHFLGPHNFQEIPTAAAFEAVASWSQAVFLTENATELMALAIKNAIINRDVAHLIFPDEIQTVEVEKVDVQKKVGRIALEKIRPSLEMCELAITLINNATAPAIIIGNGGRSSSKKIIQLAEKIDAPILTTFKAKGSIKENHPLATGVLGRSGTPVSSATMGRSDLLIVLGATFSKHTGISRNKKVIQVDYDRMSLGKFHPVDVPIWGEIDEFLEIITPRINMVSRPERRESVHVQWERWRKIKSHRSKKLDIQGRIMNSKIFTILSDLIPKNSVISVDVGNNTYSFGRYFESKEHDLLMSGYLGSIGFAFPAAIGAWTATTDRKIIAIAGDGGFGQYAMEFTTAVKYNMNITLILLNNSELGKITKEQKNAKTHVFGTSLVNPNFANFANNCGGFGIRVENADELASSIKQALNYQGPSIVEIISTNDPK